MCGGIEERKEKEKRNPSKEKKAYVKTNWKKEKELYTGSGGGEKTKHSLMEKLYLSL